MKRRFFCRISITGTFFLTSFCENFSTFFSEFVTVIFSSIFQTLDFFAFFYFSFFFQGSMFTHSLCDHAPSAWCWMIATDHPKEDNFCDFPDKTGKFDQTHDFLQTLEKILFLFFSAQKANFIETGVLLTSGQIILFLVPEFEASYVTFFKLYQNR